MLYLFVPLVPVNTLRLLEDSESIDYWQVQSINRPNRQAGKQFSKEPPTSLKMIRTWVYKSRHDSFTSLLGCLNQHLQGTMWSQHSKQIYEFIKQLDQLSDLLSDLVNFSWLVNVLPQRAKTPRTNQRVHSGKYLMKTRDINAADIIRYDCWRSKGPFQCIITMPTCKQNSHPVVENKPIRHVWIVSEEEP